MGIEYFANKPFIKVGLGILAILIFILWLFWPTEDFLEEDLSHKISEEEQDMFSNISELHWNHTPITYYFNKSEDDNSRDCRDYEFERIRDAFNIIENLTDNVLTFREEEFHGDILIFCLAAKGEGRYLTEADALPEIKGNIITNATLRFYTHRNCGTWPDVEIHEIMHLFGFGHVDDKESIMTPIASKCDRGKIDQEILSCLKYTYSNGILEGDCSQVYYTDYAPKYLSNSKTRNAGQTIAFKIPKTPTQKPVAEET